MTTLYTNPQTNDEFIRERMYDGDIFVLPPNDATHAFGDHARHMIAEAFGNIDPLTAQFEMSVEDYVKIVAPLKPRFIHHPETRKLIQKVVESFGAELDKTYLDVPRLRMVTSDAYLTTGVGFAHHAHRDTWYAAPMQQLNWWMPLYPITRENTLAFHPHYWNTPIKNGSPNFDYYEWNALRANVAKFTGNDTRFQPKAEEELPMLEPELRTVCEPDGIVLFSGAHLHSTVPNTSGYTRYSIDFRTVNIDDVINQRSAPNLDSHPKGIALRDFVHGRTFEDISESIVEIYEPVKPTHGLLVFKPDVTKIQK